MIAIVDYDMGNLHSVENALKKIDCPCIITRDKDELRNADGIILPGVGAFKEAMSNLKRYDLIDILQELAAQGKPFLGICLGMQILFRKGYEGSPCSGLNLLQGTVIKMEDPTVKIPHVGWNRLEWKQEDEMMNLNETQPFVYYVHSYYVKDANKQDIVAISTYGKMEVIGYVRHKNILGMQYHPEKSGKDGLAMLKVFKEMCE